jgi:precorrin-6B methylase 2
MVNCNLEGENQIEYKHTFWEKFHTARGNLFWKFVDWLSFKNKKFAKIYDMTVGNEYRKERKNFNLSYAKRVLHIGCGSYPITAMVIAEMKDVNVVTIDEDMRAIKRAKKILDKKNLNGNVKAVLGNGTEYPLNDFDTIIISGCAVPKEKVFERVINDADSNSNIIVRSSFINIESIINRVNPKQEISIKKKIKNHIFPNSEWDSYFIEKKG